MKEVNLFIVPTKIACTRFNKEYLKALDGNEIKLKARHYHATQRKFTPFIEKKERAIGTTAFQDEIMLKIGAKIIIIHNIDTSDGLTNGQLGELVTIIYSKDGEVDKLVIKLQKKDAGQRNRQKFPGLSMKYPNSVVIERTTLNYPIRKKGGCSWLFSNASSVSNQTSTCNNSSQNSRTNSAKTTEGCIRHSFMLRRSPRIRHAQ